VRDYTKIEAWKIADDLTVAVYERTRAFPREELYGLTARSDVRHTLFLRILSRAHPVRAKETISIFSTSPAAHCQKHSTSSIFLVGSIIFQPKIPARSTIKPRDLSRAFMA
jgi:hypothetical protein